MIELTEDDLKTISAGTDVYGISIPHGMSMNEFKEQIVKNQAIVLDIAKCIKSEVQSGKKTMSLNRLQTLIRGIDHEV